MIHRLVPALLPLTGMDGKINVLRSTESQTKRVGVGRGLDDAAVGGVETARPGGSLGFLMLRSRDPAQFERVRHVDFVVLLDEVMPSLLGVRGTALPKTSQEMPVSGFCADSLNFCYTRRPGDLPPAYRDLHTLNGPNFPIDAP